MAYPLASIQFSLVFRLAQTTVFTIEKHKVMCRIAVLLALVASSAAAFNLQPPANEWAKTGTAHELVCKSSEPVTTCSWDTPYEKNYNLKSTGAGLKAESGRLEHFSNGENECGLRINTVEAKDDGVWACNVGVVEGSEVYQFSILQTMHLVVPYSCAVL